MALHIVADRVEQTAKRGGTSSIRVDVTASTGADAPVLTLTSLQGGPAYPWLSLQRAAGGAGTSWLVVFDSTSDPRPRPGSYAVVVAVDAGGQHDSTTIRFVVERHPCLQIRPHPS